MDVCMREIEGILGVTQGRGITRKHLHVRIKHSITAIREKYTQASNTLKVNLTKNKLVVKNIQVYDRFLLTL